MKSGYIARIFTSFIDVPGEVSVAVVFAGCSIRCKGCHNQDLWDKSAGKITSSKDVIEKVNSHPLADYAVFWGGEPTDQMDFLLEILRGIRGKKVAIYTGREFEVLPQELLSLSDLIICGPYVQALHTGGWPASSNQRVLKKENGKWIVLNTSRGVSTLHSAKSSSQLQ